MLSELCAVAIPTAAFITINPFLDKQREGTFTSLHILGFDFFPIVDKSFGKEKGSEKPKAPHKLHSDNKFREQDLIFHFFSTSGGGFQYRGELLRCRMFQITHGSVSSGFLQISAWSLRFQQNNLELLFLTLEGWRFGYKPININYLL